MKNYKMKVCLVCGKKYKPTSSTQKYCVKCKIEAEKERDKQYYKDHLKCRKQYRKIHIEQIKEYKKQWYKDNSERENKRAKQWHKDNSEQVNKQKKQYYLTHKEKIKEVQKQYSQTSAGKEVDRRHYANRKGLGFILLNKWFKGSVGHHRDKEHVIFIPEELHRSISHNVFTGQNMALINFKSLQFLDGGK